jgi:hypothetical protein
VPEREDTYGNGEVGEWGAGKDTEVEPSEIAVEILGGDAAMAAEDLPGRSSAG